MIHHIIIVFVVIAGVVGVGGLAVAARSIHRAHSRITARHDDLFERVDTAMERGTAIAPPGLCHGR